MVDGSPLAVAEPLQSETLATVTRTSSGETPVLFSERLFAGCHELIIMHGTEAYRLRITSKGKLILTK